ncbi:isoflavone reductase family protein [Mycena rosella]|uniref:Isoflavone reductase family protein n=1 Tax=Mycena rosella TaxID=1033263 RepID=A0AAD7GEF7_MYCRO|nr:isoflavone reductase family protein [Mycena rosella]
MQHRTVQDVEAFVRPASADKPQVQGLIERGVKIRAVDIGGLLDDVVQSLAGIDLSLATAAKQAGVKRFVPCAFTTVAPPGGVMYIRDTKEEVYQQIRRLYLPYTIIDVGYWHQVSFPTLPSGRIDYAAVITNDIEIYAEGTMPTMLADLRDIGLFVARIIKDPRTLNKFVITYSDVLSQNEIFGLMEEMSGEVIQRKYVSANELIDLRARHHATLKVEPDNLPVRFASIKEDYMYSKYVRGDNTPAYAAYLGYLDASELYPDFQPRTFKHFVTELLEGKGVKPYPNLDVAALYI